jgi:hypothetical protein
MPCERDVVAPASPRTAIPTVCEEDGTLREETLTVRHDTVRIGCLFTGRTEAIHERQQHRGLEPLLRCRHRMKPWREAHRVVTELVGSANDGRDHAWCWGGVGINAENPFAARTPQPMLECPHLAHPFRRQWVVVHGNDSRIASRSCLQQLPGAIGGPAIDDQRFQHRWSLRGEARQARSDSVYFVQARHHHRNAPGFRIAEERLNRLATVATGQKPQDKERGGQALRGDQNGEKGSVRVHAQNVRGAGAAGQGEPETDLSRSFRCFIRFRLNRRGTVPLKESMSMRRFSTISALLLVASPLLAQGGMTMAAPAAGRLSIAASPRATAVIAVSTGVRGAPGMKVSIDYGQPFARGRQVEGGLIPAGTVWRTGANSSTTLMTEANLQIGSLMVPKGTYSVFSLWSPSAGMQLIINKQTGQWGTEYSPAMDLGRVAMTAKTLSDTRDAFVIALEPSTAATGPAMATFRMSWGKTEFSVPVTVVP